MYADRPTNRSPSDPNSIQNPSNVSSITQLFVVNCNKVIIHKQNGNISPSTPHQTNFVLGRIHDLRSTPNPTYLHVLGTCPTTCP